MRLLAAAKEEGARRGGASSLESEENERAEEEGSSKSMKMSLEGWCGDASDSHASLVESGKESREGSGEAGVSTNPGISRGQESLDGEEDGEGGFPRGKGVETIAGVRECRRIVKLPIGMR